MDEKILIVEDEKTLSESIAYNLKAEGFKTKIIDDGIKVIDTIKEFMPDIIILDIMLPNVNGIELCRIIRNNYKMPIIMLTAKNRETDKVVALEIGADDYMTKPFSIIELIARIKAHLRRSVIGKSAQNEEEIYSHHGIEINVLNHTVTIDGNDISLRKKEFDLLLTLIKQPGRVMERTYLLDKVWGEDEFIESGTVDVHIRRLREKIEKDPKNPQVVITVYGVGYKLV